MAMSLNAANRLARELVDLIEAEFYNNGPFMTALGMQCVGEVQLGNLPGVNGCMAPTSTGDLCVEVSNALLALHDGDAIKFGIAHEFGHGFAGQVLTNMGYNLQHVTGPKTEVIADLGSAYILNRNGLSWRRIKNAARAGAQTGIFDLNWSGDHPPGAERACYVEQLAERMQGGETFNTAGRAIIYSVPRNAGVANPNMQPGPKEHGTWCRIKSKITSAVQCFG